jgi:hypothetical protein
MHNDDYSDLLGIIADNARDLLSSKPELREDEGEFHDRLFAAVLQEVDDFHPRLSELEAKEISEVCGEVEGDILYGDILGL